MRAFHWIPSRATMSLKTPFVVSGKLQGIDPIGVSTRLEGPPVSEPQAPTFATAPESGPANKAEVVGVTFAGKLEMIFVAMRPGWFFFMKSMKSCVTTLVLLETPTLERRMSIEAKKKVRFFQIGPPRLQLNSLRLNSGTWGCG